MVSLRNLNTKPSQRFDFLLFFYVMGLLIGSAVWLRLIPSGDLSGRGIQTPLWLELVTSHIVILLIIVIF